MIRTTNTMHAEGLLYEHDLTIKESGPSSKNPGTVFISGTIGVATDAACTNIIPFHFTYVTAVTSGGKVNATFSTLKNILDGTLPTVMADGKDKAAKIRVDSSIGLNEFYSDRNGTEELVSARRNEGGFVHVADIISDNEATRNAFKCDMIITQVSHMDENPEKGTTEKAIVKGYIFDFRNALLPVEFSAVHESAINYFEGLEASEKNPVFTQVWGKQISETIKRDVVTESAFGDALVQEVTSARKDYVITGAKSVTYEWDTDETITVAEFTDAMQKRETYLATVKQRQDEYKASKANTPIAAPSNETFNF